MANFLKYIKEGTINPHLYTSPEEIQTSYIDLSKVLAMSDYKSVIAVVLEPSVVSSTFIINKKLNPGITIDYIMGLIDGKIV